MWGREGRPQSPISPHHDTTPISPHIDEDALEGLYFAFSTILRCLPYFFRKTRPRASYELLEAFSSSCGECGVESYLPNPKLHARIWEPGSLKVGLSITPEPAIRFRDREAQGGDSRTSDSANPNPARPILSPPHPARPHPNPRAHAPTPTRPRTHTHAPTPERPHPPHPTKKNLKKNLTPLLFAPIVQP